MVVGSAGEAAAAGRSGASSDSNDYRKNTVAQLVWISYHFLFLVVKL